MTGTAALALFGGGCSKPRIAHAKVDACALLNADDVQEVQKSPLTSKTGNQTTNGKIYISQCYFAAEPPHQSISLAVTQSDPAAKDADGAADYWRQITRHVDRDEKGESEEDREKRESLKERERGEDEEEAGQALKKIDGVGEEAYWSGTRVGGALYVFEKDIIVRISVGGPDNEEAKIDKSKKLAAKALQRL